MVTINHEITELQQRRRQIDLDEQARQAAAQAPALERARIDQQLAELEQQQRLLAFQTLADDNTAAAQQVRDLAAQVIDALSRGEIRGAIKLGITCTTAWRQHARTYGAAMSAVQVEVDAQFAAKSAGMSSVQLMDSVSREVVYPYQSQLVAVPNFGYYLIEWVAKAGDAVERQIRQGLTFCMLGGTGVYTPEPGYNAEAAWRAELQQHGATVYAGI